jgi:hypothetical protein
MDKTDSFAKKYLHWILILFNVILAAFTIGVTAGTLKDSRDDRQTQNQFNITTTKNLNDVTAAVSVLTDQVKDLKIEHGELMRMHHLYPHDWQKPDIDKNAMQPFPK